MLALRTHIENYTSTTLSDNDFALVAAAFTPKRLRRRQYLLQEGEVCKYFAFVLEGALRQYSVNNKGVEHILHFAVENWWIGDRESFVMLTPSPYNIDALEDSHLLLITHPQLQELMLTVPAMTRLVRELDQRNFIATQRRLHASFGSTAEERYAELQQQHPDFLQRFPQHMIASYLGVTAETLSRVRQKATRQ
ncbi:Crp/Fnr family transcriptional regulator [Hymenobacter sp. YC55]|uniref:Crp/Fnr family transcriptional regulator n=1 Tax=Hymenobacter sp. YC55 TaxID=3034019 RepID=UPI0023FA4156|nr:Crp/Fnr family transcriptional regulator [Hymenobacter sp. YC55]MDF7815883.1 Crp/Fnr family transcriptional regulator [Hymenobacter sp. YC55]